MAAIIHLMSVRSSLLMWAFCIGMIPHLASAAASLQGVRVIHQETVQLYLDLDQVPVDTRVFTLANPSRLVIDLAESTISTDLSGHDFPKGAVSRIRHGIQDGQHLRIVADLRGQAEPEWRYLKRQNTSRLIVDLGLPGDPELNQLASQITQSELKTLLSAPLRDVIVAIDAGHGGKDPGAIGRRKTREKDVNLAIAQLLYRRLDAQPGITPRLIRDKDVFVPLRERLEMTRDMGADIFVSIHADAVPHKRASGSSVYALSLTGASSETAQWLVENEHSQALFGEVTLDGLSADLKETLLGLAQHSTLEDSIQLGGEVLKQLSAIGKVHKSSVESGNFAVLKAPDIPSILVETAFISNPSEERKLNKRGFQDAVARAIQTGIVRYLTERAPSGTHIAARQ